MVVWIVSPQRQATKEKSWEPGYVIPDRKPSWSGEDGTRGDFVRGGGVFHGRNGVALKGGLRGKFLRGDNDGGADGAGRMMCEDGGGRAVHDENLLVFPDLPST